MNLMPDLIDRLFIKLGDISLLKNINSDDTLNSQLKLAYFKVGWVSLANIDLFINFSS